MVRPITLATPVTVRHGILPRRDSMARTATATAMPMAGTSHGCVAETGMKMSAIAANAPRSRFRSTSPSRTTSEVAKMTPMTAGRPSAPMGTIMTVAELATKTKAKIGG